jgi:3-deoxy-manno-octulosonate cytidylyltransferase (CMP-KDO synthetase)
MNVLAVIPARYSSHRLPGKALLPIAGRPMIAHVLSRAQQVEEISRIIVATDDDRIVSAVTSAGGEAWMTSEDHLSGTDRVWEVASRLAVEHGQIFDVVVDIQGDEPLLDPASVSHLIACFADPGVAVATVAAPLEDGFDDRSVVKVVTNRAGDALYFSRSRVPSTGAALQHIGLYAFRHSALAEFAATPPGPLERAEGLEQLRFLEYGHTVRVVQVAEPFLSVDTPADLARVRLMFESGENP